MKQIYLTIGLVLGFSLTALSQAGDLNLCHNAAFDSEKGNFAGWNLDYDWTGIGLQRGNHLNASYLPEFRGKKNVLHMKVPSGYESKIECQLIAYEIGDRYKCTFDIYIEEVNMKMLFNGYQFAPGIKPYEHPKLQDLRRIYKTEQMDMRKGARWQTMTMNFPNNSQISPTAYAHLKKVRQISVFFYVPGGTYFSEGNFYLSNMRITKLPGKVSVKKG
ncbi:MAG: hypothetical protein WC340_14285 [Kiritimatiellia bacterium]